MEKITEKRKEIEEDLIKVLRDFDDRELYEITIKYAKITKEKKQKDVEQSVFEEKRLIKRMMEKEISYHKELLEMLKKADKTRKKEIYDEEMDYLRKTSRILDRWYLYEIVKTLTRYALSIDDLDGVDYILRQVEYYKREHVSFVSAYPADESCVLQDVVLDLLKKDIDLGREDLVKEHIKKALDGFYGFLSKSEQYIDYAKGFTLAFTEKEYKKFCTEYRKSKKQLKQEKAEGISF